MATKVSVDQDVIMTAMYDLFVSPNEPDSNGEAANVVDGLFAIARGLHAVARSIQYLGNGEASTPFGAIEALGMQIEKSASMITAALNET